MRAVMVAVGFSDILAETLWRNARHFESVFVATTPEDGPTREVIASVPNAREFLTRSMYDDGAEFNKFKALELALDAMGRHGWLTILDCDVILPAALPKFPTFKNALYTPPRRMAPWPLSPIPPEEAWGQYPLHPNRAEWPGYCQTFHAECCHLGNPPWHEVCFRTAGTADSLFQAKWPAADKLRPQYEVLHLGDSGKNWMGRVTPYADGSVPEGAAERYAALRAMIAKRRPGPDRFAAEKLPPS